MATNEQLGLLLKQIADLTEALGKSQDRSGKGTRRVLDIKPGRLPELHGGHSEFDEWAFSFKRTIRATSVEAYKLMVKVESLSTVDEDEIDFDEEFQAVDVAAYSAELYDVLCQACRGEAWATIRTVEDMRGLQAWS